MASEPASEPAPAQSELNPPGYWAFIDGSLPDHLAGCPAAMAVLGAASAAELAVEEVGLRRCHRCHCNESLWVLIPSAPSHPCGGGAAPPLHRTVHLDRAARTAPKCHSDGMEDEMVTMDSKICLRIPPPCLSTARDPPGRRARRLSWSLSGDMRGDRGRVTAAADTPGGLMHFCA